jgi:hypothetical protein
MSCEEEDPRATRERALVRVLELTEELVALKLELGARMKQGCFELASARYSRPVSRTQYDMTMRATTRVLTRVSDNASVGGTPRGEATPGRSESAADAACASDVLHRRFAVATFETRGDDAAAERSGEAVAGERLGGLRRRLTTTSAMPSTETHARDEDAFTTDHSHEEVSSFGVVDASERRVLPHRSPLAWFGAMPPPSLRRARRRFAECVELVAKIATVSSELRALTSDSSPATRGA